MGAVKLRGEGWDWNRIYLKVESSRVEICRGKEWRCEENRLFEGECSVQGPDKGIESEHLQVRLSRDPWSFGTYQSRECFFLIDQVNLYWRPHLWQRWQTIPVTLSNHGFSRPRYSNCLIESSRLSDLGQEGKGPCLRPDREETPLTVRANTEEVVTRIPRGGVYVTKSGIRTQ